ncbi:MAG: nickel-dependent lactate racemase [Anaerolineales bacterium]|jgi:nickel-dependent lactate racemase
MEIRIPYGNSYITAHIPDHIAVDIIDLPQIPAAPHPTAVVRNALADLLGEFFWSDFKEAQSVAIAINDKTRPVPHQILLPPLLDQLDALGIPEEVVHFYIAVGTHPPMFPEEFSAILPVDILARYKVVSHDSENQLGLTLLGNTSRGTPVWINRGFYQSDLKIVVGNIEPHQFVGFSGGVKTAAVGLAGLETINCNHTLMSHPDSQLGNYETNLARQDIEEIGQMISVDLALNAILNDHKEIVHALAGDPLAVMAAGIPISRQVSQVPVQRTYGLVISSPGGHPKDINVYQSQKALASAVRITRPGGTVILTAACPDGSGSSHYQDWIIGKESYAEVLETYQAEGFRIGPHKAFQFARDTAQTRLMFYSDMEAELAQSLLLNPVPNFQAALNTALEELQPGDRVAVLPHATSTIPYLDIIET